MQTQVMEQPSMAAFEQHESEVRSYCRSFPTVFNKAKNDVLWDVRGQRYIDFFAGAGALNYGHNHPVLQQHLIDYMRQDGVTHSLDMATEAKQQFLQSFERIILRPRKLDYKVMFPGPTGTNAVESALKLARKVTGRTSVICFTNAFHGMTLGSLSVTGNSMKRRGAGIELAHSQFMPYDGYFGAEVDTAQYMLRLLEDEGSGIGLPAAIILETLQGEGGLHAASDDWLREIERICRDKGIVLIVDDVQMGCGRTGPFFSFERAGISPDIVCLSKSIGGYGLPMALTLMKPELDVWSPGEHNGTFRGNNLGFVAATAALQFWTNDDLQRATLSNAKSIHAFLRKMLEEIGMADTQAGPDGGRAAEIRGRGLIQGVAFRDPQLAGRIGALAFERGLIMETSGPKGEVMKLMPPLTVEKATLDEGFAIIADSVQEALKQYDMETGP